MQNQPAPAPIYLPTGISQATWCRPIGEYPYYRIEDASLEDSPGRPRDDVAADTDGRVASIAWLDQLLNDGIRLPRDFQESRDTARAITMLIGGPPGSGKSVLAMELCHGWARYKQLPERPNGLNSLYVSTESTAARIRAEAQSFAWDDAPNIFVDIQTGTSRGPCVAIAGVDHVLQHLTRSLSTPKAMIKHMHETWGRFQSNSESPQTWPDIVVIDSINQIYSPANERSVFNAITSYTSYGPYLTIFILESPKHHDYIDSWSQSCDIVIRLDRTVSHDYMVRTLEIIKARNQVHVWGSHQLKIYAAFDTKSRRPDQDPPPPLEHPSRLLLQARRQHPHRTRGGIFIYPSIHYHLSRYKRNLPSNPPSQDATPMCDLTKVLHGGFPAGRCTALIGTRGGHKSHLAYFQLLSQLHRNKDARALVISLRDDEDMAKATMATILQQEFRPPPPPSTAQTTAEAGQYTPEAALDRLNSYEQDDRLEILHFWPGYIAPEEFFHRVLMTIRRMKSHKPSHADTPQLTVIFNSLDQLAARFPLCAKEDIFVPGLIEMLTAEGVTSIFVAVSEQDQPVLQYGLLPMADLILSLESRRFPEPQYQWLFTSTTAPRSPLPVSHMQLQPRVQVVTLRVVRLPGGQAAGARGMLELVDKNQLETPRYTQYAQPGLHFIPFPDEFPNGEPID